MKFIIADADTDYTAALVNRIHQINPALSIARCHQSEELQQFIADKRHQTEKLLFLYNKRDFLELERLVHTKIWPDIWEACPMDDTTTGTAAKSPESPISFQRYGPVSKLVQQFNARLNDPTPQKSQEDLNERTATIDRIKPFDEMDPSYRLWCSVSFDPGHSHCNQKRLKDLIQAGRQVIYLPLMPAYLVNVITHTSRGLSLSDLLLELSQGSVQATDIGRFWQPQPEGFFCFRPPGRADDLITCEPELIRRLVKVFREKIESDQTNQMTGLVDCFGLPVPSLKAAAVLCDVCEIKWPNQNDCYMSRSARVEAGSLMAALPSSCQIIQNGNPVCHENKGGCQSIRSIS